jgi:hypothetical protein
MGRRLTAIALAAAVLAACSTAKNDAKQTSSTTDATGGTAKLTATSRGVTADSIKIGFAYLDLDALAKSGIVKIAPGPYEDMMNVLVDDVNAHGGVNGRKLVVSYAKFSPIGNTEQLAACAKLTEDDGVFAVLFGLLQDNNLCIVQQHATILVSESYSSVQLAKARAPWATWGPSNDRAIKALVQLMDRNGYLDGHTVAVYAEGTVNQPLVDEAVDALEAAGTKPVDTAVFDVPAGDTQAAATQDRVIAERFRNKHVDTVVNVGLFTPAADWDNVGYHPSIFMYSAGNIAGAAYTNPLEKFPLVAGLQASADPDAGFNTPEMRRCRKLWKDKTGKEILDAQGENDLGRTTGAASMTVACASLQIFVAAAKAAGPNLTQETWKKGLESLGKMALPTEPVASFGPGKTDGQDTFQLVRHDPSWKVGSPKPEFIAIGEPITLTR